MRNKGKFRRVARVAALALGPVIFLGACATTSTVHAPFEAGGYNRRDVNRLESPDGKAWAQVLHAPTGASGDARASRPCIGNSRATEHGFVHEGKDELKLLVFSPGGPEQRFLSWHSAPLEHRK